MKDKGKKKWIPLYIREHLWGSTRIEMKPDERSVWTDLIVISGMNDGWIRAGVGVPYHLKQLAGMLVIEEELLLRTIKICLKEDDEGNSKLTKYEDGTYYVTKHKEYALSPRHERRFETEKDREEGQDVPESGHEDDKSGHYIKEKDIKEDNNKVDDKKEEVLVVTPEEDLIREDLNHEVNYPFHIGGFLRHLRKLQKEFPDVDVIEEAKGKILWWKENPKRLDPKKSNPLSQMRNWIKIAQKKINETRKEHRVGAQRKEDIPKVIYRSLCHPNSPVTEDEDGNNICKECGEITKIQMIRKDS